MSRLVTTLGEKQATDLGLILPHEHIFVDLGPIGDAAYRRANVEDVIAVMAPEVEKARNLGVTALVECTPEGVGRRVDIVKAVSEATGFPVVVATGIYREPWAPEWAHLASQDELRDWMYRELTAEVQGTDIRAGWIKVSAGDDGITECEAKILRAAAKAGAVTGAAIGSHTIRGRVVREQLDVIEAAGYTAQRFIWIHTQAEPDFALHLEIAARGAWIEYDAIGNPDIDDEKYIRWIQDVLEAGYGKQLLLSHDRGWYDPSKPGGGVVQPYTYLSETFLPKLRSAGIGEDTIWLLTHTNPFMAFAR